MNPVGWSLEATPRLGHDAASPLVQLRSEAGNSFHVHAVNERLVRVVHIPPLDGRAPFELRDIKWETRKDRGTWQVEVSVDLLFRLRLPLQPTLMVRDSTMRTVDGFTCTTRSAEQALSWTTLTRYR